MAFFVFPDTLHKPLEEVAALFGDQELVVVYQQELEETGGKAALEEIEAAIPKHRATDASMLEKGSATHDEVVKSV